jgi:hypothetical protein
MCDCTLGFVGHDERPISAADAWARRLGRKWVEPVVEHVARVGRGDSAAHLEVQVEPVAAARGKPQRV